MYDTNGDCGNRWADKDAEFSIYFPEDHACLLEKYHDGPCECECGETNEER